MRRIRKLKRVKRCECGCGDPTNVYRNKPRRFIIGHHLRLSKYRVKKYSEESIDKRKASLKKHYENNSHKKKGTILVNGKFVKESDLDFPSCQCGCGDKVGKYRNKYLVGHAGRGRSYNKGQVAWNKGLTKEDPRVAKYADSQRKLFPQSCDCGCDKMTAPGKKYVSGHNQRGVVQSEETIRKRTEKVLGQKRPDGNWNPWSTGLTKETDERVRSISNKMIEKFKDLEWVKKWAKAKDMKPNKLEIYFQTILDSLFPGEWKYVGDFDTFIGGKCPDYININGQKKLIEVFGDYWHRDDCPEERIDHFKSYGFDCLVIWESDISDNLSEVKEGLINFYNN